MCGNLLGEPGLTALYSHENGGEIPASVVKTVDLHLGPVEEKGGLEHQWLRLHVAKACGESFSVWLLTTAYPPETLGEASRTTARYILREGNLEPLEFRDRFTGEAVLPRLGAWRYLIPRPAEGMPSDEIFPQEVRYLGHAYVLTNIVHREVFHPPEAKVLDLLPDVLVGPAHNTRQKDETRRYDDSDYELVRLKKRDYDEMIDAGISCLRVDAEQAKWVDHRNVFYWGIGGGEIDYPEFLYRSNYLGPTIFMDEPAVRTRDVVIRPILDKDEEFRKDLTVGRVLEEFRTLFGKEKYEGAPRRMVESLAARPDVDLGDMEFLQANLYSWETMISSAAHQLMGVGPPFAVVFEPPGSVGTMRTLPEMNMAYGCQIPVDDPKNLTSILYGFLRGAARLTDKAWGMSVYGAMVRADSFWYQTHAYDLGATIFTYWDTYKLVCVPYSECLALSRNLRAHAESHPRRDLKKLKEAAEVAILLPPGYNLGHIAMGRGNLWGLGELNLERFNQEGVKYRVVMGNFFTEIERCIRLGVAFDLLWDLEGLDLSGYREVVMIRKDGNVDVDEDGRKALLKGPRTPVRPSGTPPKLTVDLSTGEGRAPLEITARATIAQGSAPIYYTVGADIKGIYGNAMVPWELFGPEEHDYRFLNWERLDRHIAEDEDVFTVDVCFSIEKPGNYRLRAATVDMAGRTAVVWKNIAVR